MKPLKNLCVVNLNIVLSSRIKKTRKDRRKKTQGKIN